MRMSSKAVLALFSLTSITLAACSPGEPILGPDGTVPGTNTGGTGGTGTGGTGTGGTGTGGDRVPGGTGSGGWLDGRHHVHRRVAGWQHQRRPDRDGAGLPGLGAEGAAER